MKASVIIANWNGLKFIDECLDSLLAQDFRNFEVLVIDNGSTDGSLQKIKNRYGLFVRLIENNSNLGFATANNIGIKRSTGDYVVTLNNDTKIIDRHFLEGLIDKAETSSSEVGMWAPKILSMETGNIDSVGGLLLYPDGIAKGRGRLEKDIGQYNSIKEILFPSACAAVYRRKMLDEIGVFDELFFAYCEDTDLGLRARLCGWKAVSVPESVVFHYYSATAGKYSAIKAYFVGRNRQWVILKNFPSTILAMSPLWTFWRVLVQTYGVFCGKGSVSKIVKGSSKSGIIASIVRSNLDALIKLPVILKARKTIQLTKKISNKEFTGIIKKHSISANELVLTD